MFPCESEEFIKIIVGLSGKENDFLSTAWKE
jgi:hypothetical protein